jgi:hypothetical protein
MSMFRDDAITMGTSLAQYEPLIAEVEAAIIPYTPPPIPIPNIVTMRQARLALLSAGVLSLANAAIAAMTGVEGEAARIEWEYAQEVKRDAPLVLGMATALGLSEAQLDNLFTLAGTL